MLTPYVREIPRVGMRPPSISLGAHARPTELSRRAEPGPGHEQGGGK
jgi:hypothetical protein